MQNAMSKKPTSVPTRKADVPYDPADETATLNFWAAAETHTGVAELRADGRAAACPTVSD